MDNFSTKILSMFGTNDQIIHTYFKPLFLGTEVDTLHTKIYQHRMSYYLNSIFSFLAPSKC